MRSLKHTQPSCCGGPLVPFFPLDPSVPSFFLGNALRKVLGWCAAWVLRTSEQPLPRTLPPGQEGNRGQGTRAWTLRRDSVSWAMRESFCEPGKGKKDAWELKTPTLRDTECVCAYVQTKAVLPKRCFGVSFFPNPNALGRFVLVLFVFVFCFVLRLIWSWRVRPPILFSRPRFCCSSWSTQWYWLFFAGWFCVLLQGMFPCGAAMSLVVQKLKQRTGVM